MQKRRVGFSVLTKEPKDECLTERGREFQVTGPMYWKDLSPRVLLPILGTRNIRGQSRRVEMKHLREVWRSCTTTRDNLYFGRQLISLWQTGGVTVKVIWASVSRPMGRRLRLRVQNITVVQTAPYGENMPPHPPPSPFLDTPTSPQPSHPPRMLSVTVTDSFLMSSWSQSPLRFSEPLTRTCERCLRPLWHIMVR